MSEWQFLDEGTYNKVYINTTRSSVLKIQNNDYDTDTPERSVRIWNEINSDLTPPAYIAQTSLGRGWICPFIQGDEATDEEICSTLIQVFNRTGRIVVDASAPKNFLKNPQGKIVCIDIGMALKMELNDEQYFKNSSRRNSIISLNAWQLSQKKYDQFFQTNEPYCPLTVNTTKALLFIKSNRPDIFNIDFLRNNTPLVQALAEAYDKQNTNYALKELNKLKPISVSPVLRQLKIERPINLDSISKSCAHELNKYIHSRGRLDRSNNFYPSFITTLFRNRQLTTQKVQAAKKLMVAISKADSYEDIEELLKAAQSNNRHKTLFTESGLGKSLAVCRLILQVGKQNPQAKKLPDYSTSNTAESNFSV